MKIVTKDSLQNMLDSSDRAYVEKVVGRALVALLARQTADERGANETLEHNGVGFTGSDAKSATLTAKAWLKNRHLEDWQLEKWVRKNDRGYSRLAKYHSQLNEIALSKKQQQEIH